MAQINKIQRGSDRPPRRGLVCADFVRTNLTVVSCCFGYGMGIRHDGLYTMLVSCITSTLWT